MATPSHESSARVTTGGRLRAPGPDILRAPEVLHATMDLRWLLREGLDGITPEDVAVIYRRHGIYGATRRALVDHLHGEVLHQTIIKAAGRPLDHAAAVLLDRLRTLLDAGDA